MKKLYILILLLFSVQVSFSQTGKIKGKVYDEFSNEPLPFVNVIITGTTIGVVTDDNGEFLLSGLNPGFATLTASFIGYSTVITRDILISNSTVANVEIKMQESAKELGVVEVKASPFQKVTESPLSLKSVGLAEIETNPGSNRDISRVIQSFPGVGTVSSFRNDVIIRGGGPAENTYYLDGVEIPTINHFSTQGASGGPVGIINADFIGGIKFYSGAFPASRNDALSGVFELTQIDGNSERLKARGSLGASEMSATFDGPIGKKTTFIVSARHSYLQFLFDALGLPFLPKFSDYQLKVRTKFNKKNEFTLVSIGALDDFALNTGIENPDEFQEYVLSYLPVYKQWSYAIGGVYKHFEKHGYHTVVVSRNMLDNTSYKYLDNDENSPKLYDYTSQEIENKIRYEYSTNIKGFKLNYGLNAEYVKYNNNTFQLVYAGQAVQEVNYDSDFDMYKYGAFAQLSSKFFRERLSASLGVRIDGNSYSESMNNPLENFSPRLSLSYALTEKISANFNTGRYYQLPAYTTLGYQNDQGEFVNRQNGIKYIAANHFIGGLEYKPSSIMQFTAEGFYKIYDQYPVSVTDSISLATVGGDYGVVGDVEVVSDGVGSAYGFELMNRIITNKGFSSIISYTWVNSSFKNYAGKDIPTSWDSRHLLTLSATKNLNRKWQFGAKWRFVSGLPYTPYDLEASARKEVWDANGGPVLDYSQFNSGRLKNFQQLDIRIDRKWYFKRWSLGLYVDLQNLYNYQAQQPDIVVREKDANGNYLMSSDGESYILKSIPNESGTILPTLGILIEL